MGHLMHLGGDVPVKAVVALTNAPISALSCTLLLAIAQRLGVRPRPAALLALVYGLCTLAWPYAKTFFSEPLTGLCLLACFWALLHVPSEGSQPGDTARRIGSTGRAALWVCCGVAALSGAVLARETTVIVVPVFALYLYARLGWRADRGALLLAAAAALLAGLGIAGWWNAVRFGSPFAVGYGGHLWTPALLPSLYGLLLSPYKGLLLYVPLTLMALLCWPRFYRRCRHEALLCAGVFLVYVAVHAAYVDWPGGGNWGPRFLVPAVPFALLALPFGWSRTPAWTAATLALCAASLLIQLPAVYVSYARYYPLVGTRSDAALFALTNRQPGLSPIAEQWRSVGPVTAALRNGAGRARLDLSNKLAGQPVAQLPLGQALRRSITVNVPDFWLVYLALSGHLTRLLKLVSVFLALLTAAFGVALGQALYTAVPASQPMLRV